MPFCHLVNVNFGMSCVVSGFGCSSPFSFGALDNDDEQQLNDPFQNSCPVENV